MVWAIASQESVEGLLEFREQMGIEMPILNDETGQVFNEYRLQMAFPTGAYPHDWVVGTDGTFVYYNNRFDHAAMVAAVEAELNE